jgi:hypothetical protein
MTRRSRLTDNLLRLVERDPGVLQFLADRSGIPLTAKQRPGCKATSPRVSGKTLNVERVSAAVIFDLVRPGSTYTNVVQTFRTGSMMPECLQAWRRVDHPEHPGGLAVGLGLATLAGFWAAAKRVDLNSFSQVQK